MNWAVIAGLVHFLRGHDGLWNVSHLDEPANEEM
jgi:hypothetical protein